MRAGSAAMSVGWTDLPLASRRAAIVGARRARRCARSAACSSRARSSRAGLRAGCSSSAIALGGMMNVMIHELTGGHWGLVLRRPLEAAMLTLPLCALLALPLAFGLPVAVRMGASGSGRGERRAAAEALVPERAGIPAAQRRVARGLDRVRRGAAAATRGCAASTICARGAASRSPACSSISRR